MGLQMPEMSDFDATLAIRLGKELLQTIRAVAAGLSLVGAVWVNVVTSWCARGRGWRQDRPVWSENSSANEINELP
jgi:hypothetical protein